MCILSHMLSLLLLCSHALAAPAPDASNRLMRSSQDNGQVNVILNHDAGMQKRTPNFDGGEYGSAPEVSRPLPKPHTIVPLHLKIHNPEFHHHAEQYVKNQQPHVQPSATPGVDDAHKIQVSHASLLQDELEPVVQGVDAEMLSAPSPLAEAFSRRFGGHASTDSHVAAPIAAKAVPTSPFAHTPMAPEINMPMEAKPEPAKSAPPAHEPVAPKPAELDAVKKAAAVAAPAPVPSIKAVDGVRYSDGSFEPDEPRSPTPAPSPTPLAY